MQQQNIDNHSTHGENDSNSTGSGINLKRKAERSSASSLSSFDSDNEVQKLDQVPLALLKRRKKNL